MKKINILFFVIFITAVAGCKKGSNNKPVTPPVKTYLLKSITEYTNTDTKVITDYTYSYDDQNRLVQVIAGVNVYKFTYDGSGNLIASGVYQNNVLVGSSNYTYSADSIQVTNHNSDGLSLSSFSYALTNKRVSKTNYHAQGYYQYDYDNNGNVSVFTITNPNGTKVARSFSYDQKKNPFSMIGGNNPQLIYFLIEQNFTFYSGNSNAFCNVNNLTVNPMGSVGNSNLSGTKIAYTYNSDGFPLAARVALTAYVYNAYVTYTYMVK